MGTFGILSKLPKLPLSALRYPPARGISKLNGRFYSAAALAYQTEDDEWDDLSSASISNSYRLNPIVSDTRQAVNFKSTSASGLDLTSNCLVQQMLFNSHLRRNGMFCWWVSVATERG
ncbi:hypothetical protein K493DRAFT_42905 [Basidiobolus meristosporus CBS 931.73]|uniref:Uncharacterized protein n=1 Tax=Basidiobolus meristosporus CBS 931.73 TaxID=1314790 RepID=A0A1Y1Y484_9FUNG|nr:hypothetical protein K493DRAFT_42905 [Basidiobolus meristosporus CBS 931.73]|eukprot:ORX92526.1 hypothetical protein K493DRAFT_42905 [Basidiobolus meristosporus CBS 931.73]